jgi:hypothetical protein
MVRVPPGVAGREQAKVVVVAQKPEAAGVATTVELTARAAIAYAWDAIPESLTTQVFRVLTSNAPAAAGL